MDDRTIPNLELNAMLERAQMGPFRPRDLVDAAYGVSTRSETKCFIWAERFLRNALEANRTSTLFTREGWYSALDEELAKPVIAFRPIDDDTPRDRWILVRWKDQVGEWAHPIAVRWFGQEQLRGWWRDGIFEGRTDNATHWCEIPPDSEDI